MTEDQRQRHREANRRYRDRRKAAGLVRRPPSPEARERKNQRTRDLRVTYGREWRLRTIYRMSPGDYDRMLAEQGGGCAICLREPAEGTYLDVDHDHRCCVGEGARTRTCGKCVRGLVCRSCNSALHLLEDAEKMARALTYLGLKDSLTT